MHGAGRRTRRKSSDPPPGRLLPAWAEWFVLGAGMLGAAVSGAIAYHAVGPYGDGPFGAGFRRIPRSDGSGRSTLAYDFRYAGETVRAVIDERTRRAVELRFDTDADGVSETRAYVDGTTGAFRVERDVDADGVVDRWEHYEDGMLVRVETDGDGDGRADTWSTYVDGVPTATVTDAGGDGRPDADAGRGGP